MSDTAVMTVAEAPVPSLLAGEADLREVLEEYVATMDVKRARYHELLKRGDFESLEAEAHQLAGSAGSYGYPEMSRLALSVEQACRRRDAVAVQLAALDLIAHIVRIVAG